MISGKYIFICTRRNINESDNFDTLNIQESEPIEFPFTILPHSIKDKTYDVLFDNLYNSKGTQRLTGMLSVNDGSFCGYGDEIIKIIYQLRNIDHGGHFIIYNDMSATI
jgi:hypothetical protein